MTSTLSVAAAERFQEMEDEILIALAHVGDEEGLCVMNAPYGEFVLGRDQRAWQRFPLGAPAVDVAYHLEALKLARVWERKISTRAGNRRELRVALTPLGRERAEGLL